MSIIKSIYGIHKTKNLNDGYFASGTLINNAKREFGLSCFKREILEFFDSEQEMVSREIELVTREFCESPDTYNMMPGGKFGSADRNGLSFKGKTHSDDSKRLISKARKNQVTSEETREKQSKNNFARNDPERHRAHAIKIAKWERTEDYKSRRRELALNRGFGNKNLGSYNVGRIREKVKCPHCEKLGAMNTMSRFHFDNCKQRPAELEHVDEMNNSIPGLSSGDDTSL